MKLNECILLGEDEKEERLKYIRRLAENLGYTPTRGDIPLSEMAIIKKHYTAWTKIIPEAGLESFNTPHQQKLRKKALDIRLKKLAQTYSEEQDIVDKQEYELLKLEYICKTKHQPEGLNPIHNRSTKEEIKSYLRALARELGYSPTMPVTRGSKQIIKKYKAWQKALKAADLEPSDTQHQCVLREEINEKKFLELLEDIKNQ